MKKKILFWLVGGIIFVLVGTGSVYYLQSKKTQINSANLAEPTTQNQNIFPQSGAVVQKAPETVTASEIKYTDKDVALNTETTAQEVTDIPPEEKPSILSRIANFVLPDTIDANGLPLKINYSVPFTSQAPNAEWDDDRYQDGCEEASVLMAYYWTQNKSLSKEIATKEIANMSAWEVKKWGTYHDSSVADTKRLLTEYFNYTNVAVFYDINAEDIKKALQEGGVVIVPADGRKLNNPYFTPPGPPIHMLVIRGYDDNKKEFITNDPGTKRGEEFRYSYYSLMEAIRDYPTGYHVSIESIRTAMIVVKK